MSIKELQTEQQPIEVQQLKALIIQISAELVVQTPGLPNALATIHKMVQEHEELIHILNDEDTKTIHLAFESYKRIKVFADEAKKATKSKSKKLSDNDLSNL